MNKLTKVPLINENKFKLVLPPKSPLGDLGVKYGEVNCLR
jgi:hypothetical protein